MSRTTEPEPRYSGEEASAGVDVPAKRFRRWIRESKVVPGVGKGRRYSLTLEQIHKVLLYAGWKITLQALSARLLS